MDFLKYKDRLIEYVKLCGYEVSEKGNTRCFLSTHPTDDKNPSLKFYDDDRFKCFGCDQAGDIYDIAGLIHGIADKADQFKKIESAFKDEYIPPKKPKKIVKIVNKVKKKKKHKK